MFYEGIHHVSLLVTDLKKSKNFYGNILGFKEIKERPNFDFAGAWYQVGNNQIHLIIHEQGKTLRDSHIIDTKDGRFAVRVTNMEKLIEKLLQNQIEIVNKPQNKTKWHQVFICDPDGNIIEFNT